MKKVRQFVEEKFIWYIPFIISMGIYLWTLIDSYGNN
jgi:hypothetical protein